MDWKWTSKQVLTKHFANAQNYHNFINKHCSIARLLKKKIFIQINSILLCTVLLFNNNRFIPSHSSLFNVKCSLAVLYLTPRLASSSTSSSPSPSSNNDDRQQLSPGTSSSSLSKSTQRNGPRFIVEPPNKVQFLNETGAIIQCRVLANIQPIRVWWSQSDGSVVGDVHGLRHVRPNGDLVLSPFQPALFRQDIHSTIYRCMATNSIGTVRSRDCEVRAVIQQQYSVQVYGEYAIAGNTGHMKCQIPAFVRDYVRVTAWLKGETIVATNLTPKDSRFVILINGDLLIRNTSRHDSGFYRCQTRHDLSQETMMSSIEGHFIVNDVYSGVSPRISSQSPVKVQQGNEAELVCVTKAWPHPTVRWFQTSESGLITPVRPNNNLQIYDSFLHIRHTAEQHSGNWICVANNSLGEERAYIELLVIRPPAVRMMPDFLLADMSSTATFICNITHGHALSVLWIKDGQPIISASAPASSTSILGSSYRLGISGESRIRLIEPHILNIRSVIRDDAGCYQCIVHGEDESTQSIGELKLGDSPPMMLETFAENLVYEDGAHVSLKCSATSTPLPQIRWFLDDHPIEGYAPRRISMADYVRQSGGHVVSYVNITNAKVVDSGEYRCVASNNAGQVSFSARVNVVGTAAQRPNWSKTEKNSNSENQLMAIASRSVTIRCPIIAYPIESLVWQHRGTTLPNSHRQSVEPIIGGVGGKLIIQNVHRDNDQGEYVCTVKGSDGKSVRGSVQVMVRVAPLIDGQLISPTTIVNQGMKVKLMCSILEGDPSVKIKWYRSSSANKQHEPTNQDHHFNRNHQDFSKMNAIRTNHAMGISVQEEEDYSLLTFRSVSIRDMGNWTCLAWNDIESVNKSTYLVVNVAPSWRIEPKNSFVVLGQSLVIDCSAEGHPQPRILWKKSTTTINNLIGNEEYLTELNIDTSNDNKLTTDNNNGDVNGQQQPSEYREVLSTYRRQVYPNGTFLIQEAEKSDAGFYMCQVSNGIGAGLSKVIQLTVQSPPFFATKFLSKSVSKGEAALLECEAQGDPALHIRWFKDRLWISPSLLKENDQNNDTTTFSDKRYSIKQDIVSSQKVISFLQITTVQREDSTIYTCVARNDFGTDNTSVQLIVQEVPDPPQSVEVIDLSSRTVQFQWKSPYSGNSALIRFHLQYRRLNCTYLPVTYKSSESSDQSSPHFFKEIATQNGNELRLALKSLTPSCFYETRMSSENQIGRSEHQSPSLIFKTMEEVPGGPPIDVQVETTSSTSLKIKWRPPIREVHFGRIRGYYIGYKVSGSDEPFQYKNVDSVNDGFNEVSNSPDQSHQVSYITNLKRKTSYVIILQAYNNVGPGPRSDEIQVATFDSQPPTSPLLEVVSTTYDAILLKWDSSFQQAPKKSSDLPNEEEEEKEYLLYFREDQRQTEWHQKRIFAKTNQFVLNRENSQGRIRCGTKYHLYMTATNSLGTGEPSETVVARTKGEPPTASSQSEMIVTNSSTAVLSLKSWQARGCPIHAFTIQYKPVHQKQWIPLAEYYEASRDHFFVTHLSPNRDYQLLVSAHTEAGVTRQEYTFHTPNMSSVVRLGNSVSAASIPLDPYRAIDGHQTMVGSHLRNFTVLLPVMISLVVLIIILGTLFGCLRRQHVNHVANHSLDHQHSGDHCSEHSTCLHNGKIEQLTMMNGTTNLNGRRDSSECYPLSEFRTPGNTTCPPSINNSNCDSKSNLLNGNLSNGSNANGTNEHLTMMHELLTAQQPLTTGTSPRHKKILNLTNNANHFATLNSGSVGKMKQLMQQQAPQPLQESYYSSPQRKLMMTLASNGNKTCSKQQRSDHEYAEPLQTIRNRCAGAGAGAGDVDFLLIEEANNQMKKTNEDNHCLLIDESHDQLQCMNNQAGNRLMKMISLNESYATINKKMPTTSTTTNPQFSSIPYL